jgi:hypothetical protein
LTFTHLVSKIPLHIPNLKPFLTLLHEKGKNHKDVLAYESQHPNLHDSLFLLLWSDFSTKRIFKEICDFLYERIQKKKLQFCFLQNSLISLFAKYFQGGKERTEMNNLAVQYFKNYDISPNSFVEAIPDFLIFLQLSGEHKKFFETLIYEETKDFLENFPINSEMLFSFLAHNVPKSVWKDAIVSNEHEMNLRLFQFICTEIGEFDSSQIVQISKKLERMKEKVSILDEFSLGFFINHCITSNIEINDFLVK